METQHTCRFCHQQNMRKNGFLKGKQRYLCRSCHRNQILEEERVKQRGHPESMRHQALVAFKEGLGFRSIARILKVSPNTVMRWIKSAGVTLFEAE